MQFYEYAADDFERACQFLYYLIDELEKGGEKTVSHDLKLSLVAMMRSSIPDEEVAGYAPADSSENTEIQK